MKEEVKGAFLMRFLQPFMNERGAVGEGEEGDDKEKQEKVDLKLDEGAEDSAEKESDAIVVGFDDLEEEDSDDPEEGEKKEDKKAKDTATEKEDEKYQKLLDRYNRLSTHKTDLDKALHEARQKKGTDAAPKFTRAQLKTILEENQDDPDTLLNVIETLTSQAAKTVTEDAMSKADLNRAAKEADTMLLSRWPSLAEDGSDLRLACDEKKEQYGLGDSPLGDLLSMSLLVMDDLPSLIKKYKEEGRKEALGETAEEKVKAAAKSTKLKGKGEKGSSDTAPTQREMKAMKALSIKPESSAGKNYLKMVRGTKKNAQVEEED